MQRRFFDLVEFVALAERQEHPAVLVLRLAVVQRRCVVAVLLLGRLVHRQLGVLGLLAVGRVVSSVVQNQNFEHWVLAEFRLDDSALRPAALAVEQDFDRTFGQQGPQDHLCWEVAQVVCVVGAQDLAMVVSPVVQPRQPASAWEVEVVSQAADLVVLLALAAKKHNW